MNIVYIHTHDTGRYIEPYGHNIPTPNLMELAKEGTLFRNAFCAGPTCSPSRAALLTGMMPHSNGMIGLAHRGFELKDYNQHLVNFLRKNNYETVLCGMQHEAKDAEEIGYDRVYIDSRDSSVDPTGWDRANAESAIHYIKEKKDKPFFLSYGLFHTHRPFVDIDESIDPNYVLVPSPIYDNEETRRDMAGFITSAIRADECIGEILKTLRDEGLENDTIIIFTTDHGIAFPHMKCNLYDSGIGVSLIIKYPGNGSIGKAKDAVVSHMDIFPTLCDLLQLQKPDWLQGKSLIPLLKNEIEEVNSEIYSEVTYHAAYNPQRTIRTKRYKYIRLYGDHEGYVPANIDNGLSKDFLLSNGLLDVTIEKEMLFDLYFDPQEGNNLIDNKNYQSIRLELSKKLDEFMTKTNDPMCLGAVEKPAGAIANKISCIDPDSKNDEDYE